MSELKSWLYSCEIPDHHKTSLGATCINDCLEDPLWEDKPNQAIDEIIAKLKQTQFPELVYVAKNYTLADLIRDLKQQEESGDE